MDKAPNMCENGVAEGVSQILKGATHPASTVGAPSGARLMITPLLVGLRSWFVIQPCIHSRLATAQHFNCKHHAQAHVQWPGHSTQQCLQLAQYELF